MRYIPFVLSVFLLPLMACGFSATTISKGDSSINENASQINKNGSLNDKSKENLRIFDSSKINLKYPMVWVGDIVVENGELKAQNNNIWSNDELNSVFNNDVPIAEIEVDIMNCAGYLGSGTISYSSKIENIVPEWKVSILSKNIDKDAFKKVKLCDSQSVSTNNFLSSNAFAIAPKDNKRQTIKIAEVNTQQLFDSLPKATKKWLNSRFAIKAGRKKNTLSVKKDSWTDLDGDGKIDLIMVSAAYNDEADSSTTIMLLVKGTWRNIGSIQIL